MTRLLPIVGAMLVLTFGASLSGTQPTTELPTPVMELSRPALLPELEDPIAARHRLFQELDRMQATELLDFHEALRFGHRDREAVEAALSDPPQLSAIRSELEAFVAIGDDKRTMQLYEMLRIKRRLDRQRFEKTLENLDAETEPGKILQAVHEDGDGESWDRQGLPGESTEV